MRQAESPPLPVRDHRPPPRVMTEDVCTIPPGDPMAGNVDKQEFLAYQTSKKKFKVL